MLHNRYISNVSLMYFKKIAHAAGNFIENFYLI